MAQETWPALETDRSANGQPTTQDTEALISRRLASMSLVAKVGQMVQGEIANVRPEDVREHGLGSVLNGGGSWPNGDKHASAADWRGLADAYRAASLESESGIPILWGTDAVHGHNNVLGATVFPHNIGLGAAGDAAMIEAIAAATAREVAATGIDWTFAPTLAVVRDDRWGRTYESYSEDPAIVEGFATRMVRGLQGAGGGQLAGHKVLATAKHFIGDGGTGGVDQGDTVCAETQLRDVHGPGHFAALAAGVQVVMASFSSWNGAKLHGHGYLLTDVLKGRLGFDGFVISDWNGCQQLAESPREACALAVNAGVDMVMVDERWSETLADLIASVEAGEVPMARVDDAVRRILRVKASAGLLAEGPLPTKANSPLAPAAHRALARQAVRQSLVLLKNNAGLLPLQRNMNVLVAGSHADDVGLQCGGWTLTWQGDGNANEDFPQSESILAGIREAVAAGGGSVTFRADGAVDETPDVAIVVFGEPPYAEGEGDRPHLAYSAFHPEPLAVMRSLKAKGIPVVAVFVAGRPMWTNPELNAADAFLVAWLPGTEGGGVADVLFRASDGSVNHDLAGKLSFSWPRDPWQTAVNVGDEPYDPLFPYGFGLRYADAPTTLAQLPEDPSRPVTNELRPPHSQGSGS